MSGTENETTTESTATIATFGDNHDTWRFAAIAFGVLLLISLTAHVGGPSSANAAAYPNQLALNQQQAHQSLSIGGFTAVEDEPAFVIMNEQGQRIGVLPMNAADQVDD